MAVRFLFGRAGTGKTHRCLQAIREQLLAEPISGPELILFIPEQAAVQTERNLLAVKELAGASRYRTLSFRRLQQLVLKESGLADREVVGPVGRQMILQYLLIRNRRQLQVLEKVAGRPGTAAKVAAGLVEFMQQGILSSQLRATADQVEQGGELPPGASARVPKALLVGKLRDLALLYDEYLQWLRQGQQADPAALLAETAEQLGELDWLHGAHVWVDGFASFSAQQRYMLTKLSQVAGRMEIGLLMDPALLKRSDPIEPHELFYVTHQTYRQLQLAFEQANVTVEEPVLLEGSQPARFKDRPRLAHIEAQLFETTRQTKPPQSKEVEIELVEAPDRRAEVEAVARKIVDLARVAKPSQALRYRQIGVIVRDLEPYHDLFQTVFAAYGIPYFIDRRRGVSHHPLVELIRALLRLLVEDWPIDAVATLLKTGLTPIPRDRADLVENYLLAHGIEGWENWHTGQWSYLRRMIGADEEAHEPNPLEKQVLAKANYARRIVCDLLRDWANPASNKKQPGLEWADRLYKTLEQLKVAARLARWHRLAERKRAAGSGAAGGAFEGVAADGAAYLGSPRAAEHTLGQQHERVWQLLVQLLDDLVAGLGQEKLTAEQFQATIEAGLEAFSLPLIPPVVDQVVIGSVERSRQPELIAAFVLGFNEGLFPRRAGEDVLLSDHERELLAGMERQGKGSGVEGIGEREREGLGNSTTDAGTRGRGDAGKQQSPVASRQLPVTAEERTGERTENQGTYVNGRMELPTGKQRLFDERMLVYIALTRASRYVWLSYAGADETGKKMAPSPYLRAVEMALPDIQKRKLADPLASLAVADVGTDWQAATGVVLAAKEMTSGNGQKLDAAGWRALWGWMRGQLGLEPKVQRVASACGYGNTCSVRAEQAKGLCSETLLCSVSQLQEYAACPYRYFARYGLRLRERPEFELAAVELGSFYHRILYKVGTRVRQRGLSLRTVSQDVLNQVVHQAADEELAAVAEELALAGGREQYLLGRAKADLSAAIRGHVSLWRNSHFEPALLEATFGMDGGLPALEIDTPKGRRAVLRGKIDRIDVANVDGKQVLTVIDYKRSSRYKFRLDSALAGLQVQLVAYMKAAAQAGAAGKIGGGGAELGGMYYFNLLPTWQRVAPGELADAGAQQTADAETRGRGDAEKRQTADKETGRQGDKEPWQGADSRQWQLKGFTNTDWLGAFGDGGNGDPWPMEMRLTSKGQPYANVPAGSTAELLKAMECVWQEMGKTVDNIVDGQFAIQPYRMGNEIACTYCVYDGICRFGPEFNRYREVETCGTRALLERLSGGGE